MSSVQVLLAGLQNPSSPVACQTALVELLGLCRYDGPKHEFLAHGGLDALAALTGLEMVSSSVALTEALLELLMALLAGEGHAALARVAEKPPLLEWPLGCIRQLMARTDSKKHSRGLRLALDVVDHLSYTAASRERRHQEQILITLLRVLEDPNQDAGLLLHATEMIGCLIEGNPANVVFAANFSAVAILLRLLVTPSDRMDLKRSVCEVVLVLAESADLVPIIVANNAIHALALCLRARATTRHVGFAIIRLLVRLADYAKVYGQIVNEEMIPLLFELVDRHVHFADLVRYTCQLLEGISRFARGCRLDLAPFLAPSHHCDGQILVRAATEHSIDPAVVTAVFSFFSNLARNPNDLPELFDGAVIEGLLALYIVNCGTKDHLAVISEHIVRIMSSINKATLETMTILVEDQTLPALFLCLRGNMRNTRFASRVFTVVTKFWQARTQAHSAHSVSGFVGLAIEILSEHCREGDEMNVDLVDLYVFVNEVLQTEDGVDTVLACGGKEFYHCLCVWRASTLTPETHISSRTSSQNVKDPDSHMRLVQAEVLVQRVMRRLEVALSSRPTEGKAPSNTATVYGDTYSPLVMKIRVDDQSNRGNMSTPSSESNFDDAGESSDSSGLDPSMELKTDDECDEQRSSRGDDDANDVNDDSDSDEVNEVDFSAVADSNVTPPSSSYSSMPRHLNFSSLELQLVNFSSFDDSKYAFVGAEGAQYPKHPCRTTTSLLQEPPAHAEPCRMPETDLMAAFIEVAMRQRLAFVSMDPHLRARIVYENKACFEKDNSSTVDSLNMSMPSSSSSDDPLYYVPEQSRAFANCSSLTFDSWFESGNLERVTQVGEFEYDLLLRRDLFTSGHTQWFYFAVSNVACTGAQYRFNIINLCKPDSLFNQGLQPVVYSVKDAHLRKIGWRRAGQDIHYFPNPFVRPNKSAGVAEPTSNVNPDGSSQDKPGPTANSMAPTYFTLTFTLQFDNVDDTYLIAHSYPYTFSDNQHHLQTILQRHRPGRRAPLIVKHSILCTTSSGRPCDLMTISDFTAPGSEIRSRRAIFLTSRVHPGEVQASWIMRGVIDYLVSAHESARLLRRLFVFFVIPMLNPDGVFYGNSRCCLSGCDLNRHWHNPCQNLHPTIFHTKQLIQREHQARGLIFFCDIHGHSRKKNVFLYGCDTKRRPNPRARVFARLFAAQQSSRRFVSFPDCSFKVSKDKETTARVVLANEMGLGWCFTLEASFCGASFGELQNSHFHNRHMQQVGSGLCETLLLACISDGNLRDRLQGVIEDYTISIPGYADTHLRETGVVIDTKEAPPPVTARQTTKKSKSSSTGKISGRTLNKKENKSHRRRRFASQAEDEKDSEARTARRSSTTKRSSRFLLQRAKSSPLQVKSGEAEDNAEDSQRRDSSGDAISDSRSSRHPLKSDGTSKRRPPITDLLGSLECPDEVDMHLTRLQTIVRACGTGDNNALNVVPKLMMPLTPPIQSGGHSSTTTIRRSFGEMHVRSGVGHTSSGLTPADLAVSTLSARELNSKIIPPPVSEILSTRSPKPPTKSIRFRGAGRQYAAVSSIRAAAVVGDPMLTGGYAPALIQASTIALKHRVSSSPVVMSDAPVTTRTSHTVNTIAPPPYPRHRYSSVL